MPGGGLPDGVKKEIVKEAPSECWKTPKPGDEVEVHYVGTLESDGSQFDSSRDRGQPFSFTLGQGQVIKGWDLGVASMKKGEVAKLTLAPEFAYGESGSPPKIPANATLVFEIELISWASKDDLFSDEGVIKTIISEGSGWKSPKAGDEVLVSIKTATLKGTAIEERSNTEYVVASDSFGPLAKAVDKALMGMKKGEKSELKCSKDYAYGEKHPDGAILTLTLYEIFETKDISLHKDRSVMKKQIQEGEGWDTAKYCAKVTMVVEAATDGTSAIDGFQPGCLEFVAGNGEVCDALECAATEMKKGEKALLFVHLPVLASEEKLGLKDIKAENMRMTVVLKDFEKGKDTWSMDEDEKIAWGTARKNIGTQLLKAGRLAMALQRYKKVSDAFCYTDNMKTENKGAAKALKIACELNKAAVYLRLKDYAEAKAACNCVLKDDKQNVKALYRHAQAELGLKNFLECIADCKKVAGIDAQNRDVRVLLKEAHSKQREEDKIAKGLFANMCKALGKGPIPPPGKKQKMDEDEDEDEDDYDAEGSDDVPSDGNPTAPAATDAAGDLQMAADGVGGDVQLETAAVGGESEVVTA